MKHINKIALVLLAIVGIGISGCGGMPKCNSKDTTDLITQILKEQLYANASYKYDAFITNSTNEKAKKVTCKAQVTITRDGRGTEKEFIEYSAQYTDDGQILVEVWPAVF